MKNEKIKLIAITGGPGAGKTTVLNIIKKSVCEHIAILPEAATVVYSGGFWRLDSPSAKIAAQNAIFCIQSQMESLVKNEGKWTSALCDRATLDGLAYWPKTEQSFWESFNTTKLKEYAKYGLVIHLRSPSKDFGYNYINPMRTETPDEALEIDKRIHKIWKDHPHYHQIRSTKSFIEKINQCVGLINENLPNCCENQIYN